MRFFVYIALTLSLSLSLPLSLSQLCAPCQVPALLLGHWAAIVPPSAGLMVVVNLLYSCDYIRRKWNVREMSGGREGGREGVCDETVRASERESER